VEFKDRRDIQTAKMMTSKLGNLIAKHKDKDLLTKEEHKLLMESWKKVRAVDNSFE
jgi:hypothetical protein